MLAAPTEVHANRRHCTGTHYAHAIVNETPVPQRIYPATSGCPAIQSASVQHVWGGSKGSLTIYLIRNKHAALSNPTRR